MISVKDRSFGFIVTTTSLAFVVSQLDVSIVNIALPSISKAFSAGISSLQWIADAYTIAFAALMLSAGGIGDRLGSKLVFQIGFILFGIASTGCGLAWSTTSLIAFRAWQGMGAAILNTTRQAAGAMGVAIFGALANGGALAIANAVLISGIISCVSVAGVAVLLYRYIERPRRANTH
jgi:MFS family permease